MLHDVSEILEVEIGSSQPNNVNNKYHWNNKVIFTRIHPARVGHDTWRTISVVSKKQL